MLLKECKPPMGPKLRKEAEETFRVCVKRGDFNGVLSNRRQRTSRKEALALWNAFREENPWMTEEDVSAVQKLVKSWKRKQARETSRANGVSSRGRLVTNQQWRVLQMGDYDEKTWMAKLSFVPIAQIASYGAENLKRLQDVHERLVAAVRLRGGAATTTTKHQKGTSLGLTVAPGGRIPHACGERDSHYSGTIQPKQHSRKELNNLQVEVQRILTACVEEAFGNTQWYKATKEAFRRVPANRRLPNSTMPASNIWWNWNDHSSEVHIDWNTVSPCFVLTPYTYEGAELLCQANNMKIPLKAGQIVGGSWQRFPHCSDKLRSTDRYSFVVYFDYRCLCKTYWVKD